MALLFSFRLALGIGRGVTMPRASTKEPTRWMAFGIGRGMTVLADMILIITIP
jgi:hypothetical protein